MYWIELSSGRAISFVASILQYVAMIHGLKGSTFTCRTTWLNQVSTAVGPLCQRMSWHPLQISWRSAAFYNVNFSLKCWKLHWHILQQTPKCFHAVRTTQSLESDQSDTTICASVKVSDYYTVQAGSVCGSPLSAPTLTLSIKTSIWAPLYPAGSHWSSVCNPPWV